jgi:putative addiction module component (TIGR02574 family)
MEIAQLTAADAVSDNVGTCLTLHSRGTPIGAPQFYVRHTFDMECEARYNYFIGFEWSWAMNTQLLQQASVLDVDEQIELVEAIWDSIVSRGAAPALTETQKTELDRRLADHLANPNDVIPWSEVKAAALAKIRQ